MRRLPITLAALTLAATHSFAQQHTSDDISSFLPEKSQSLAGKHFTWGADIGASIDMDVDDMSTFNADVTFGYKNSFIRLAGLGVGIHRSFGQGHNFIPVYAIFRSSFRSRPSLCFLDLKAGCSFNSISGAGSHTGFYGGAGIGFNLSQSARCRTHIILSYGCLALNHDVKVQEATGYRFINYAELKFGVSF